MAQQHAGDHPNEPLGFEISGNNFSFVPTYYPKTFTEMKKKDMERHGSGCEGESVSIKEIKNREFRVAGVVLRNEIYALRDLQDSTKPVDLLSPLFENGGMECYAKRVERGDEVGWDAFEAQRLFEYDIDLVSTGTDEHEFGDNGIVTEII